MKNLSFDKDFFRVIIVFTIGIMAVCFVPTIIRLISNLF